ncbi:hypothetical protein [Dyella choica]|uniref:Uncharacterized protein n=1 Tax=Dyella choica TaxID=1927959 RepID=A0A432M2U0_9GAMM|nr:hypothetical protein [Dyella choica]RUL72700.1 hypothetical protein EKH80_16820 [Dyella choica]
MTSKKPHRDPTTPAETLQDLAKAKHKHAQQTPAWPGARERAEPQHAHALPANDASPGDTEKTPPTKSGHGRSDINKRHH